MSLILTVPDEIVRAAAVVAEARGVSVEQALLLSLKADFLVASANGSAAAMPEAKGYSTDEYTVVYETEESEAAYQASLTPEQRAADRAQTLLSLAAIDEGRTSPAEEVYARLRATFGPLKNGK